LNYGNLLFDRIIYTKKDIFILEVYMVESDYQELIRQGASLRRKSGLTVTEIANRIEVSQAAGVQD
jgi:ribosome-binding protein aMBF1 (putative translation factor)